MIDSVSSLDPSTQYGLAGILCAICATLLKFVDMKMSKQRVLTVGQMPVDMWRREAARVVLDRNALDVAPTLQKFTAFAERQTEIAEKQTEILQALQRDMQELIAMERARRAQGAHA